MWKTRRKWKYFYAYLGYKGSTIHSKYFFFFNFKLLSPLVMLKMINIYPLFIALSMFQTKHFGDHFEKCCWNLQHWCFLLHAIAAFALRFSINAQWLRVVLFRRVLLLSPNAGVSLLRVGRQVELTSPWLLGWMKLKFPFWCVLIFILAFFSFFFFLVCFHV